VSRARCRALGGPAPRPDSLPREEISQGVPMTLAPSTPTDATASAGQRRSAQAQTIVTDLLPARLLNRINTTLYYLFSLAEESFR
jgi:hypothetical protein